MPITFYYDIMSQPCRAVYIFLKMEGIPFNAKEMSLIAGENQHEDFLKVNPLGKVPVIDDNGFILTESTAILKYLSDNYASTDRWYPKNFERRARVDEYCAWYHVNTRLKSIKVYWAEVLLKKPASRVKPLVEDMGNMLDKLATVFLKDQKFLAGDSCTSADLLAACEIMQVISGGVAVLSNRRSLQAWIDRVKSVTNPYFDEAHVSVLEFGRKHIEGKL